MEPFIQFIVYIFADIVLGVSCNDIFTGIIEKKHLRRDTHSPSRNKDVRALQTSLDEIKLEE